MLPDLDSAGRAVARNAVLLDRMFPARGPDVRQWLRRPRGELNGILFVADTNPIGGSVRRRGGQRIVGRVQLSPRSDESTPRPETSPGQAAGGVTTNGIGIRA